MSGFLGTAGSVISGLSASANSLAGLLTGVGSGAISIGKITLQNWEIPEQVSFGGQQQTVVHKFVGGARVIDVMGRDDKEITWSGMMIGPDAAQRARALDQIRKDGAQVLLVFGDFAENVVVGSFEASYKRANWIGEYSISCIVVSDPSTSAAGATLLNAGSGGLSSILGLLGGGISSITSTVSPILAGAQTAITNIGNIVLPVTSALGIHVPFLTQAQSLATTAQSGLTALGTLGGGVTRLASADVSLSNLGSALTGGITQTGSALGSLAGAAGSGNLVANAPSLTVAVAAAGEHAVAVQSAGLVSQTGRVFDAMKDSSPNEPAKYYMGADFSPFTWP